MSLAKQLKNHQTNKHTALLHETPVRLGIIGLGHMGGYHASACKLIPSIDLVAIADTNPDNFDKITWPSPRYTTTNFIDLLDHVNAVIIAVPTEFHHHIAKTCLQAGKHVLIEKPLTKTVACAEELFAIATEKKLALHVGHVERFNGAVQELKKIIYEPYLIESERVGPFTPRVQNDTVILDLMIHDLDIIIGLVNSPIRTIHSLGRTVKSSRCDIAVVQIEFENGVLARLTSSRASQVKRRTMSIHQQDAFIQLDFTTQDIFIHRRATESVNIEHNQMKYKQEGMVERLFVYKDNPLKQEIEYFIQAIKTGTNLIDPEQDLFTLDLTLKLEQQIQGL